MLDSGEVESGVDVEAHYGHVLTQGLGLRQPLTPAFVWRTRFLQLAASVSDQAWPDGLRFGEEDYAAEVLARENLEAAADSLLGRALDMGARQYQPYFD